MAKIAALLSGGVDSSVAAALLAAEGHEIVGVHLKLATACNEADERDARLVADQLKLPHYTLDITADYQQLVALDLVAGYAAGITPNPDVSCNREIKFGVAWKRLQRLGFEAIATGHYARVEGGRFRTAVDTAKDQTYFLWAIERSILSCVHFPIGRYQKAEVRALARRFGLATADKKDSQGICFLGPVSLSDYLGEFLSVRPGAILNTAHQVVGEHRGYYFFTEGQRTGLAIGDGHGPYYVVARDPEANTITVASAGDPALLNSAATLTNLNWLTDEPTEPMTVSARCRYRQPLVPATYDPSTQTLSFEQPQRAIAVGQSAVMYQNDLVLGGGIIKQRRPLGSTQGKS